MAVMMDEETALATITRFNRERYSSNDLLFIKKLKASGLSNIDIAKVIGVLESVCSACLDSELPCHCCLPVKGRK